MRKSRSAHIKCDCGEKTSKCSHLQQPVDGHRETCCCNHGGRCTCALKKEPSLDTVPEAEPGPDPLATSAARPKPPARRRRANTVHSDGAMAFDQNGNHKPATKHNRAAQKSGPYQLNRVNSATSASSLGASSEGMLCQDGCVPDSFSNRSRAATAREQRRVKSETASPLMSGSSFTHLPARLPPLDLSGIEYPSYVGNSTFEMFGSSVASEVDGPIFSAGLSATSVDWSHYDLGEAKPENFAPSSYSQAGGQSFNGVFDFGSGSEQLPRLANTTSTSGEVSEVEDFMGNGDADLDSGFGTSSFVRQANIVGSSTDLTSIGYESFYNKNSDSNVAVGTISMVEEDPAFWMPNYNERIAPVDESPDPTTATSMGTFWEL
ncbi:transcriptional activator haa1 [Conoideocrella luteorostrata]|uniref:Transcriptional activator haa1 n=1 Tax=Conoideocrella luteorostrata TaxID=1105319 RepID=A0AAJ0CGZ3_9HYPO|nr:transcriptional activator haa1 [Conoideocrella luteorostrata]